MADRCIAAATKGRRIIVVYLKDMSSLCISLDMMQGYEAIWFDPSSGEMLEAEIKADGRYLKWDEIPWDGEAVLLMTSVPKKSVGATLISDHFGRGGFL